MDKIMRWLTRIIFVFVWPDGTVTEDRGWTVDTYEDWLEEIRYYLKYADENCLRVRKVRGLLAFFAYTMMKGEH